MSVFLVPSEKKGLKIALDRAIVFIGRHPDCDVVLTRSRKISRKHCAVAQVNNSFVIRDLGSMNGIRVNKRSVRKEVRLKIGDEVTIGDLSYTLAVEKPSEPEPRGDRRSSDDARSAGVSPRLEEAPQIASDDLSREFPVAIPDPSDEDIVIPGDTPKSIPLVDKVDSENGDDSPLRLETDESDDGGNRSRSAFRPE